MNPRILAVLIPIAVVSAVACSSPASAPTWTYGPAAATPMAVASPAIAPTIAPSADPSVAVLGGDVEVTMTDAMRFEPGTLTVKAGEPITFTVRNAGVIVHEFYVGTEAEQIEHAAEMAIGGMTHHHDNALSVKPGETGSLTMTFAKAASLLVGCHEPGHYAAGMQARLIVVN